MMSVVLFNFDYYTPIIGPVTRSNAASWGTSRGCVRTARPGSDHWSVPQPRRQHGGTRAAALLKPVL